MVTENYINSLFYTSSDFHLKKDIEQYSLIKEKYTSKNESSSSLQTSTSYTLDQLGKWYEEKESEFFFILEISKDNINHLVKHLEKDFTACIINNARTFAFDQDTFKKELTNLMKASSDESLKAMNHYTDGSYIEMPSYVSALSFLCQINDYKEEWLRLYDVMKIFPLKGALAHSIKTPQRCIEVIKTVCQESDGIIDVRIFQEIFFNRLSDSLDNLNRLKESKILEDKQRDRAKCLYEHLEGSVEFLCSEFIDISLKTIGSDNTVAWVIELKEQFINKDKKFIKYRLMVVESLFESLKTKLSGVKKTSGSFGNCFFYLSITDNKNSPESLSLINSLIEKSYGEYFYDIEPDKEGLDKLRVISSHLSENLNDIMTQIRKNQPRLEGYKIKADKTNELKRGNRLWMSALFLQIEYTKDSKNFKKLADTVLSFEYESVMSDDYFIPLYIAELVASQVLKDCKDWYETKLIWEFPDLVEVVRILTANDGDMSDNVKEQLCSRVQSEWNLELICKPYYNKDTIKFLEKYLHNSGIKVPSKKDASYQ